MNRAINTKNNIEHSSSSKLELYGNKYIQVLFYPKKNNHFLKKIVFSFFVFLTLCFSVSAQKSADLKYNLEISKVYKVKYATVQNTTQSIQGQQQSAQATNNMVFSLKPLKLDGENIIAEVRIDTIFTATNMPPMEINSTRPGNLNSSNPAEILECIFNRMSKSVYLVKMTFTGQIAEIMNIDQVSAAILQGIDSIQGPLAEFVKTRSDMMVGEDAIKAMIEVVIAYLPGKEIKIGEKWESDLTISSGGMGINMMSTYQLNKLDKTSAEISGDLVIEPSGNKSMEMNGATISYEMRGIGKSTLSIDPKTGWIIKGTYKQQMKGDMNVSSPGGSMQIPVEINTSGEISALP